MIIKIEKDKLIEPLKNLVGVAEKKQTMPILGNVLFRADHGSLLLVASDLEVEISTRVDYQSEGALDSALPGRKLLDILRSLPGDGDVTIDFNEDKATIKLYLYNSLSFFWKRYVNCNFRRWLCRVI